MKFLLYTDTWPILRLPTLRRGTGVRTIFASVVPAAVPAPAAAPQTAAAAIGVYEAGDTGILAGTLSLAGPTARLDRKKLIAYKAEMQKTAHDMQEAWILKPTYIH